MQSVLLLKEKNPDMGAPQFPHDVKLFTGVLYRENDLVEIEHLLEKKFNYSKYYEDELGASPMRIFFSFENYFCPDEMRKFKLESNQMEAGRVQNKLRTFNIDPGYIDLDKIVLATTKPATYRIYLGEGIYAQSTLFFKDAAFHPWPWTYRDYTDKKALDFFTRVRNQFKEKIIIKNSN
jgi:hypothetical protein